MLNVTCFITLYLHKYSFMFKLKVPVHMCRLFSIILAYTENTFSHDKKYFSQCKVDFSFSYTGQYKIDYILFMVK